MKTPDLSIIIVSRNTRELLAACLDSVFQSLSFARQEMGRDLPAEVIVVDNASTDGTVPMVRRAYPQVRLIENPENAGFARANNQGIALSRGLYVLLLNTDAFLRGPALVRLIEFMQTQPQAGAAGPRLYFEDGTLQRSCWSFPTLATELYGAIGIDRLFPHSPRFGQYHMTYWDMRDLRQVDVVMGACLIIRREALEQIGPLDERFFMYSEEVDWCYRLRQAGWHVYFVPDAEVIHLWGGTSRTIPVETIVQLYRSRLIFFRKHYGLATATVYKAILVLACVVRLVAFPVVLLAFLPSVILDRKPGKTRLEQIRTKSAGYRSLLRALPSM